MSRLGEGLDELARRAGLQPRQGETLPAPAEGACQEAELEHWLGWAAGRLEIEMEPVGCRASDLTDVLAGLGPAIVRSTAGAEPRFFLILGSRSGRVRLIRPDLRVGTHSIADLRAELSARLETPLRAVAERVVEASKIRRNERAAAALVRERLSSLEISGLWMLRPAPTSAFSRQLQRERVPARLAAMLALFAGVYALEILAWTVIGDAALNGRVDFGWLGAWVLLALSAIPLRLAGTWIDSMLALDIGALLKVRLLVGALRHDLDVVKGQGVGRLLDRY